MATLAVHAYPKSSRNALIGWCSDAKGRQELKVCLTAAPENGKANAALIKLLASALRVSKSSIVIASGESSRHKVLTLDVDDEELTSKLAHIAPTT